MSKIGRKPIDIDGVTIAVKGHEIHYKGPKASGAYALPAELQVRIEGNKLHIDVAHEQSLSSKQLRDVNAMWGLHRALLANDIKGATQEFEKLLEINGLGYKALVSDKKIVLTLGYSHKIDVDIPKNITIEVDKTGQKVKVKSFDKFLVGQFCSEIRALRPPEPYKGKGIKLQSEVIIRKSAGKSK